MWHLVLLSVQSAFPLHLLTVHLQFAVGSLRLQKRQKKSILWHNFAQNLRYRKAPTLKTLIWQLHECTWSIYSPCSLVVKVSTWMRNGTPFSPPCFLGVNSVLMQFTCADRWYRTTQADACFTQDLNAILYLPEWRQRHSWKGPRGTQWCWGAGDLNEAPGPPLTVGHLQTFGRHQFIYDGPKQQYNCWGQSDHLYLGSCLQVCSTSIPPAVGALCIAADDHETPLAQCSVDEQVRSQKNICHLSSHRVERSSLWARCEKDPPPSNDKEMQKSFFFCKRWEF